MTDFVLANKIEVFCRIGCSEVERAFPQRIVVSVRLAVDTKPAARSREVTDSVCYATVARRIREIGTSRKWILVEELADVCANHLLEEFGQASEVQLVIEKSVLPGVEWVGVEINRSRS